MKDDFKEIGHSGGKIAFIINTDESGRESYQVRYSGNRPVPVVIIGLYALPEGIPVSRADLVHNTPPPFPNCVLVLIASDSEGKFGYKCPSCSGYWRAEEWPTVCPYCALHSSGYKFLSDSQRRYVQHYCETFERALSDGEGDREVVINMDEVADAVGREGETPTFYFAEESQQNKFNCTSCGRFNDILGRFGYCSYCGTRNDITVFEDQILRAIRDRLVASDAPENCLRDAVAAFDSYMAIFAEQLRTMIPMTQRRQDRLRRPFQNLSETRNNFCEWFDIDICQGMDRNLIDFCVLKFHRRHVYEHNGGEVDQRYIDDTGDTSVRLKQHIHENQEEAHKLLGLIAKMARNVHRGFHELFPPIQEPITAYKENQERIRRS